VLLWVVVVVLVVRRHVALSRLEVALLAGLALLALLTGLSTLWSIAPAASLLEAQRTLLYLAAATVLLLLLRRHDARAVAAAITASITIVSGYALIDRLIAVNPLPYFRLGGPVGYWNTLGALAAAGVCLAVPLIAHERHQAARAAAGFAVPVLVAALYLTFSRGSWAALVIGLGVIAATDARRRELAGAVAAIALPSVAVVGCGALADALTTPGSPRAAVQADAHRYALAILLACAASAALAMRAPRLGARLPGFSFRRAAAAALVCAAVVAVVVAGGPRPLASRAARAFDAPPPNTSAGLNTRVVSLSGSVRGQLWKVAATSFADRPLSGSGAGTYGRLWVMKRDVPVRMEDAHNLYLETLAELGVGGFVVLFAVLAIPLGAARRVLRTPYVPALLGTYIALLAHAAIDWDWEMPVVIVAALACGLSVLAEGRGAETPPLRRGVRLGGALFAVGLAAGTFVLLTGNRALDSAAQASDTGSPALESRARTAERWVPWSPDPPRWRAAAALRRGYRPEARRLLEKALDRDSTDWSLWVDMAVASRGAERTRAASRAQKLNPTGQEVFFAGLQNGLFPRRTPPRTR
jgi:O-antigen ligase